MSVFAVRPRRIVLTVAAALVLVPATPTLAQAARHHHNRASTASFQTGGCPDIQLAPSAGNVRSVAAATLCLINYQRTSRGMAPLQQDAAITGAATSHSLDMVANNYFGHIGRGGSDPLSRLRAAGYIRPGHAFAVAENIATATGSLATPLATVTMWMNSPTHRVNILNPAYRDTGMGVAPAAPALLGRGPGATYTQDFVSTS